MARCELCDCHYEKLNKTGDGYFCEDCTEDWLASAEDRREFAEATSKLNNAIMEYGDVLKRLGVEAGTDSLVMSVHEITRIAEDHNLYI